LNSRRKLELKGAIITMDASVRRKAQGKIQTERLPFGLDWGLDHPWLGR
jgi:hypothetical protein